MHLAQDRFGRAGCVAQETGLRVTCGLGNVAGDIATRVAWGIDEITEITSD